MTPEEAIIRGWALHTGLTKGREEDIAFLLAAFDADRFSGRELRKFGTPLSPAERKHVGITGRSIVSAEFIAILSDAGRADIEGAAWMLTLPANNRIATARDLERKKATRCQAVLRASNMAAGPCRWATANNGKVFETTRAMLVPVDECAHPDQCACRYQARFDVA